MERAVVGLLRLAIRLLRREEIAPQVSLQCFIQKEVAVAIKGNKISTDIRSFKFKDLITL